MGSGRARPLAPVAAWSPHCCAYDLETAVQLASTASLDSDPLNVSRQRPDGGSIWLASDQTQLEASSAHALIALAPWRTLRMRSGVKAPLASGFDECFDQSNT